MNAKEARERVAHYNNNKDGIRRKEILERISKEAYAGRSTLEIDLYGNDVNYFKDLGYIYKHRSISPVDKDGMVWLNPSTLSW